MKNKDQDAVQYLNEQMQFAKSGVVVSDGGADVAVTNIAASDPLRASAGSVAVLALRALEADGCVAVLIDPTTATREVRVIDAAHAADAYANADAVAGTDAAASITVDGGDPSGPMTNAVANGVGLSTKINLELAPAKPTFSVQSLINKLEDVVIADETKAALVFVNQATKVIKVLTGVPAAIHSAMTEVADTIDSEQLGSFTVDTTPAAASSRQFGE